MKFTRTIVAFAAIACMISVSFAETLRGNASSGKKTKVTSQWIYSSDCYSAAFSKVSFRQPTNGKLSVVRKKVRVPKGRTCAGKLLNGFDVFYRSKTGFRGRDRGTVYFSFDGGRNQKTTNVTIIVNVK